MVLRHLHRGEDVRPTTQYSVGVN